MTVATVAHAIAELGNLLSVIRAPEAKAMRTLYEFLQPFDGVSIATFLKKSAAVRPGHAGWTGQCVSDLLPVLDAYESLLKRLSTRTTVREFSLFVEFLRSHKDSELGDLIDACKQALSAAERRMHKASGPNEQLVANYVARLKAAIGSDTSFEPVYAELQSDKAARKQELGEIVKRLTSTPRSTFDRKKALNAIRDLHRAAKGFDLKLKAMSGRSAA